MEISKIYLKSLTVDNYKSLKDCTIELHDGLNIIIGKNGAGKSNLLDFIYSHSGRALFSNDLSFSVVTNFQISIRYTGNNVSNSVTLKFEQIKKEPRKDDILQYGSSYELTINKTENRIPVIKDEKLKFPMPSYYGVGQIDEKLVDELEIQRYFIIKYIRFEMPGDYDWLTIPTKVFFNKNNIDFSSELSGYSFFKSLELKIKWNEEERDLLSLEGINSARDYLVNQFENHINSSLINSYLKKVTPITEIRLNPNLNIYSKEKTITIANLSVDFLIDGDWMPWSYLSDGTKRLFYIISECISLDQGVILIEEPELGIHPHQLNKVLDFLKEQSKTKQIIISTHSPLTLDILKENELNRVIVAKYEKGTKFSHLSKTEISKAKKYMNDVGELSYYWLHSDLEK